MAADADPSAGRSVNTYGFLTKLAPLSAPPLTGGPMLYDAYEMQRSLLAGASTLANIGAGWMQNPVNPFAFSGMGPHVAYALDVFYHAAAPRGTTDFGRSTPPVAGHRTEASRG